MSDASPPPLPPRPSTTRREPRGEPFGRYVLESSIGAGGMGTVYRAWDRSLSRTVALKILRPELSGGRADLRERFQREARAAARLRHPAIVALHEVGEVDGAPYLTMDLIEGGTLVEQLAATSGPKTAGDPGGYAGLRRELLVFARVVEGVGYAHGQGIVHRDLKPANVLVDREGQPYVSDFGLAKDLDQGPSTDRLTQTGAIMGTPGYMSPEQAEGTAVTAASDVFSLGVILYEILTGQLPFRAPVPAALIRAILLDEPVAPRTHYRKLHRDLETICLRCLEKSPARRYPDGDALHRDLRSYLEGEPILARPISLSRRGARWVRRHRLVTALLVFAVGLLATGILVAIEREVEYRNRLALRREFETLDDQLERAWQAGDRDRRRELLPRLDAAAAVLLAEEADPGILIERGRMRLLAGLLDDAEADLLLAIEQLGDGDARPRAILGRVYLSRYLNGLESVRRRIVDPAASAEAKWAQLEALDPALARTKAQAVAELRLAAGSTVDPAEGALLDAYLAFLAAEWAAVSEAAELAIDSHVTTEAYWLAGLARFEPVRPVQVASEVQRRMGDEAIAYLQDSVAAARGFGDARIALAEAKSWRIEHRRHDLVTEAEAGIRPLRDVDDLEDEVERALADARIARLQGADPRRVARTIAELAWTGGEIARKMQDERTGAGEVRDLRSSLRPFLDELEALDPRDRDHLVLGYMGRLWECYATSGPDDVDALRRAADYHDEAIRRGLDLAAAFRRRGDARYELGRALGAAGMEGVEEALEGAIQDYDRIVANDPWARRYRGLSRYLLGERARRTGDPYEEWFQLALDDLETQEGDLEEVLSPRAFSRLHVAAAERARGRDVQADVEVAIEELRTYARMGQLPGHLPFLDESVAPGWAHLLLAQDEEKLGLDARGSYTRATEVFAGSPVRWLWVLCMEIEALMALDRFDEACAAVLREEACSDSRGSWLEARGHSRGLGMLADRLRRGPSSVEVLVHTAAIHARFSVEAGSDSVRLVDTAFALLQRARDEGSAWSELATRPGLAALHADPRWGR